jgi:hypothetical protein
MYGEIIVEELESISLHVYKNDAYFGMICGVTRITKKHTELKTGFSWDSIKLYHGDYEIFHTSMKEYSITKYESDDDYLSLRIKD